MTSKELREFTSQLTPYQLDQIKVQIMRYLALNEELEDATPECCPFCRDATAIIKKGRPNGKQMYQCKTCGRRFRYDAQQITAHSQQPRESWIIVIEDTLNLVSLDATAMHIHVCHETAFNMRHKLLAYLEALVEASKPLEALVELDETYVIESQKGKRVTHRKPRKHGEGASQRGLSTEQCCVCVATDRNGNVYAKCSNRAAPSSSDLIESLGDHIAPQSVMLTDGGKGYGGLASHVQCKQVVLIGHESYDKVHHLNTVNGLHSRFKDMIRQYRGVATKYLNRYVALFTLISHFCMDAVEAAADELRRSLRSMRMNVTIESAKTLGLLEI